MLLSHATDNANDKARIYYLHFPKMAHATKNLLLGMIAYAASVVQNKIRFFYKRSLFVPAPQH
jgi:hypothetical protein